VLELERRERGEARELGERVVEAAHLVLAHPDVREAARAVRLAQRALLDALDGVAGEVERREAAAAGERAARDAPAEAIVAELELLEIREPREALPGSEAVRLDVEAAEEGEARRERGGRALDAVLPRPEVPERREALDALKRGEAVGADVEHFERADAKDSLQGRETVARDVERRERRRRRKRGLVERRRGGDRRGGGGRSVRALAALAARRRRGRGRAIEADERDELILGDVEALEARVAPPAQVFDAADAVVVEVEGREGGEGAEAERRGEEVGAQGQDGEARSSLAEVAEESHLLPRRADVLELLRVSAGFIGEGKKGRGGRVEGVSDKARRRRLRHLFARSICHRCLKNYRSNALVRPTYAAPWPAAPKRGSSERVALGNLV
jgi:hypothetical protein